MNDMKHQQSVYNCKRPLVNSDRWLPSIWVRSVEWTYKYVPLDTSIHPFPTVGKTFLISYRILIC